MKKEEQKAAAHQAALLKDQIAKKNQERIEKKQKLLDEQNLAAAMQAAELSLQLAAQEKRSKEMQRRRSEMQQELSKKALLDAQLQAKAREADKIAVASKIANKNPIALVSMVERDPPAFQNLGTNAEPKKKTVLFSEFLTKTEESKAANKNPFALPAKSQEAPTSKIERQHLGMKQHSQSQVKAAVSSLKVQATASTFAAMAKQQQASTLKNENPFFGETREENKKSIPLAAMANGQFFAPKFVPDSKEISHPGNEANGNTKVFEFPVDSTMNISINEDAMIPNCVSTNSEKMLDAAVLSTKTESNTGFAIDSKTASLIEQAGDQLVSLGGQAFAATKAFFSPPTIFGSESDSSAVSVSVKNNTSTVSIVEEEDGIQYVPVLTKNGSFDDLLDSPVEEIVTGNKDDISVLTSVKDDDASFFSALAFEKKTVRVREGERPSFSSIIEKRGRTSEEISVDQSSQAESRYSLRSTTKRRLLRAEDDSDKILPQGIREKGVSHSSSPQFKLNPNSGVRRRRRRRLNKNR
jgi:hypothetical protein